MRCVRSEHRLLALVVAASCATILVGCIAAPDGPRASPERASASSLPLVGQTIGRSVKGRPIEAVVLGHAPEVVLILASIHGSEGAGTPLVEALIDHLAARPDLLAGRTVVLVPRVNPDGLVSGTRHNANGVDLNRNYPAGNYASARTSGPAPLSEPESGAVMALLERFSPDRIVSIHQPLGCIDYDGPGRPLAEAMAAASDLPVRKLGARPGSLGAYAGETLGIPIITLELPGGAERQPAAALWEKYGAMLLVVVGG